jgi:hypothetical protein
LTGGEASDSRNFEILLDLGPDIAPRLTGFVKDGVKLARTMKASVDAGLTKDVAVAAAGFGGWPPDGTTH